MGSVITLRSFTREPLPPLSQNSLCVHVVRTYTGGIPAALRDLDHLRILNLESNQLVGESDEAKGTENVFLCSPWRLQQRASDGLLNSYK